MNDSFAFIVGIEKYDQPKWDVDGPCANALAVAEWCAHGIMAPENIFVFLDRKAIGDKVAEYSGKIAALKAKGVNVGETAQANVIDTFWRTALADARPAESRLLVFWSGHGYTENDGTRIFVCRDYTAAALKNRVFNASNFLRYLRSGAFQCFSEQLFIADVCGTYTHGQLGFVADKGDPGTPVPATKQTACFATTEGGYAIGTDEGGEFSDVALAVLKKFNVWPARDAFTEAMNAVAPQAGQTPFTISLVDETGKTVERRVGTLSPDTNALVQSVFALLSPLNLSTLVFRRHFLRTVNDLGTPKLAQAQGLSGMINGLASLRDSDGPETLPYGLVQFLVRIQQEDGFGAVIGDWLDGHASQQMYDRNSVLEKVQVENAEKLLIIEVMNDKDGRICEFEPHLRTKNLRLMKDERLAPEKKINGWDDFTLRIGALIQALRTPPDIGDFQVHFFVNAPLFDHEFHMIPTSPGQTLGEQHVVLLRERERGRFAPAFVRGAWQQYADELRSTELNQLKLVPIPAPSAAGGGLPNEKGFCYATFILQAPTSSQAASSHEKQLLRSLIKLGIPYLYWLHSIPPGGDPAAIEKTCKDWLQELRTLDEFPGAFTLQRIGNAYARQASLLWDDPQFNPFPMPGTAGVK